MPNPIEGVPIYGYEGILRLAGLATAGMLKRDRKRPGDGQKPAGQYFTGYEYAALYRLDEVVDLPALSPGRQRLYDANRTCARCSKRSKTPWGKGRDGKRYCSVCQEPAAKELWDREQAERRRASAAWAREVLADESVVLAATRPRQFWREAYATDLSGAVLLDAKVRFGQDITPYAARAEGIAETVAPADVLDRVLALAQRRLVVWRPGCGLEELAADLTPGRLGREPGDVELPRLAAASGDGFGKRYDNWVGRLAGSSYRWHPSVAVQPCPWEPDQNVAAMRSALAEMAQEAGDGSTHDGYPEVDRG
jgi:uncharacterized Zn finger protein (UPF0148 family)